MKILKNILSLILLLSMIVSHISCKKFLDAKPDENLGTLNSLENIQLFLDDTKNINELAYPAVDEVCADTYYLTTSSYNAIAESDRNLYLWKKDLLEGASVAWQNCYKSIFIANVALRQLDNMEQKGNEITLKNKLRGNALFFRSFYLHALTQVFTLPYDESTSDVDLGIPLRLDPEFKSISTRATLRETYDQIIGDLKEAANLMPIEDLPKTRPTKLAAYALLSRTYLSMREYDSAGVYANKCLQLYDGLLNYNDLTASSTSPIPQFNKEILFWTKSTSPAILATSNAKIESTLYQSYVDNDLRKTIFFRNNTGANSGTYSWKGGYHGSGTYVFGGLVTDEMYLTRAECYARAGNTALAMKDLNDLLRTRWKKVNGITTYLDQTASDSNSALIKVLQERKKSLLYRGVRWMDMRRLSKEPQFAETYKREIDNQTYELAPGSPRYALQIPLDVIQRTGMPQNP